MTKEEFLKQCEEFIKLGYSKNFKNVDTVNDNGTHYFYKVIEYDDDDGSSRAINQLLFNIWHFERYADRVPSDSLYSFEPVICFSRNTDERIDLHIHFPKHTVEYLEQKAKEFGDWCKQNMEL